MRQSVGAWILCLWFAGVAGAGAQLAMAPAPVDVARVEIKHLGPPATGDEFIRAQLRVKPGSPYNPAATDDDVRNLYATGLFSNIRVTDELSADGVVLTYTLQGRPRLTQVLFKGNEKYSDRKLRKKVSTKPGDPVDERKLFNDTRELLKFYEKKGAPGTTVKYVLGVEEASGKATATFEITEAPKVKIKDVIFDGATEIKQKELRKTVKTRRRWWLSWLTGSGRFKEDQFEEDKLRLEEFYFARGYLDFSINDVRFESPTPETMVIHFDLTEGTPYRVGAVQIDGARLFPTNSLEGRLQLVPGATFTPGGLATDVETIQDFYGSRGYLDVTESARGLKVVRSPNIENHTIDLQYEIVEGQKSFIEKIEIRGNTKTRDKVIRRELAVSPGEVFDSVSIKRSRTRLEGLGYFSKVDLRPESTTIPNRRNLVVGVDEKNTGNIGLGAGFSSVDSLVGFVEFTQGNFDIARPPSFQGGGQKLRLRLQLGTSRQDYTMQFVEPWFLGRKLEFSWDLYYRELGFQSLEGLYDESRGGTRVGWRRPLWTDFFIGGIAYTLENVGIINVDEFNAPQTILDQKGFSLLSELSGSLTYDARRYDINRGIGLPVGGQKTELLASVMGGPLGGDQDLYKLEARTAWYFRPPTNLLGGKLGGHVLEIIGRTGVAQQYSNTPDVPFYERYYLGGLYSLRGYQYRAVGPREAGASGEFEPIGGKTYWYATAEYSIPIIERFRVAAFYDIGMVYPNSFSYEPDPSRGPGYNTGGYSDNWGVGVRLNLPIGPLRLDYAFPITHDEFSGSGGRFQFGIGYTRDF